MLTAALREMMTFPEVGAWIRSHLPDVPVSMIREAALLRFHFAAHDEVIWTVGVIVKHLQQSEPATCVGALWYLCRAYDEQNETSDKVHAYIASEALLEEQIDQAPFFWYDEKECLCTLRGQRNLPDNIEGVVVGISGAMTTVRVDPSPWLKNVLLTFLLERAT